jgi:hypothetical protein
VERRRDARQHQVAVLEDMSGLDPAEGPGGRDQQAVVRTDEVIAAGGPDRDGPPLRADAGVDDRDMAGARREIRHGAPQQKRAVPDRVLADVVADVDDLRVGGDADDHRSADGGRAVPAEVGQQRDDGSIHRAMVANRRGESRGSSLYEMTR